MWAYTPWFLGWSYNFLLWIHIVELIRIRKNVSKDKVSRKGNAKMINVVWFLGYKVVAQAQLLRKQQRLSDYNSFWNSASLRWMLAQIIWYYLWGGGTLYPPLVLVLTFNTGSNNSVVLSCLQILCALWCTEVGQSVETFLLILLCLPDLQLHLLKQDSLLAQRFHEYFPAPWLFL